jgi:hypothetical protein
MPVQPPEPPRRQPTDRRFPEVDRDDGMARTRIATRWIAIGGLAGVGVFAGLAAVSTHHAAAKSDVPAVDQPDTTSDPAATDAPAATAPAATSPAATTPETTPATSPQTTPATTPRVTTPATTPRVSTPATTPSTLAPAVQAPVRVPSRRHAAVSGGS